MCFFFIIRVFFVCVLECPEGPNVPAIVGGSLAAVALIGLLILLLIKGLIYLKDLKEWKRFEKEQQRSKWADVCTVFLDTITHHSTSAWLVQLVDHETLKLRFVGSSPTLSL